MGRLMGRNSPLIQDTDRRKGETHLSPFVGTFSRKRIETRRNLRRETYLKAP